MCSPGACQINQWNNWLIWKPAATIAPGGTSPVITATSVLNPNYNQVGGIKLKGLFIKNRIVYEY